MNDERSRQRIAENWQRVRDEVGEVVVRCGRNPSDIRVVGVSKYVNTDLTQALIEAGCRDLGESRPQSLWQKAEQIQCVTAITWHLIGHLQTNKVRRLIRHRPLIHSIDSQHLIQCVADESVGQGIATKVLLEVNISGDAAKTGLAPDAAEQILQHLPSTGVEVVGLMAMAGWGTDPEQARQQFERTRELRDRLRQLSGLPLTELSMGMSGDFAEAIAEGSTMVRIGSRLFEGIDSKGFHEEA